MKTKWPTKKLGEVCDIEYGTRVVKSRNEPGKYYVYGGGGKTFTTLTYNREDRVIISRFGMSANCVRKVEGKFFLNDSGLTLSPKSAPELNQDYLDCFLFSVEDRIFNFGRGQAQRNLNIDELKKLEIPLPPLSDQKKIVKVLEEKLGKVKEAIKLREDALADTEKILPTRLAEIFEEGKKQGWEVKELGEICEIKHGYAFKSQYFTNSGDHVLLTPGNFFEKGGYRDRGDKQKYYKGPIPSGFVLDKNDLLIAMTEQAVGLLGSPIFVPESNKFLHNQRLGLVVFKNRKIIDPKFLYHFFNLQRTRDQIEESGAGTKVRHTSPKKIYKIKIQFPDLKTQEKIVKELDELSARVAELRALQKEQLQDLKSLERAYLHEAFSGQLVKEEIKVVEPTLSPIQIKRSKEEWFAIKQGIGAVIEKLANTPYARGEMVIAKYMFFLQEIFKVHLGLNFVRHRYGPYDPDIRRAITASAFNKDKFFRVKGSGERQVYSLGEKAERLLESKYGSSRILKNAYAALDDLMTHTAKAKSTDIERLATVCKIVQDIKSTDEEQIIKEMHAWKGNRFSEIKIKKSLQFIISQGWDKKLIN